MWLYINKRQNIKEFNSLCKLKYIKIHKQVKIKIEKVIHIRTPRKVSQGYKEFTIKLLETFKEQIFATLHNLLQRTEKDLKVIQIILRINIP